MDEVTHSNSIPTDEMKYSNVVLTRPKASSPAFKKQVDCLDDELDRIIDCMIRQVEGLGIAYDEENIVLSGRDLKRKRRRRRRRRRKTSAASAVPPSAHVGM